MGNDQDVKDPEKSSNSEEELDDKHQKAGSDSDISDDDKSKEPKSIPYPRFKEVVDKLNKLEGVVDFFRSHIETPEDLVQFKEWRQSVIEKAEKEKEKGELTSAQLAKLRQAMDAADPERKAILDQIKADREAKLDAQFDDAEDQIRELCDSAGFPKDEKVVARIAVHVMDEIRTDEKLLRMWHAGNLKCVDKAFKKYTDEFLSVMRKGDGKQPNKMLEEKRRIMRLPALPSGKSGGPSGAPERKQQEKGITKQTHEDAWEVFQSHMNE